MKITATVTKEMQVSVLIPDEMVNDREYIELRLLEDGEIEGSVQTHIGSLEADAV